MTVHVDDGACGDACDEGKAPRGALHPPPPVAVSSGSGMASPGSQGGGAPVRAVHDVAGPEALPQQIRPCQSPLTTCLGRPCQSPLTTWQDMWYGETDMGVFAMW